jgi:FtsZ-interacting cell division protein YlmF
MKVRHGSFFDKITMGKFTRDMDDDRDEMYDDEYEYDDDDEVDPNDRQYVDYGKTIRLHKTPDRTLSYIYPKSLGDATDVCRLLKEDKIVHVDLCNITDKLTTQRIIDCMGGMIYALEGKISRSSDKVFIIASRHVNVEGEKNMPSEDEFEFTFKTANRRAQ